MASSDGETDPAEEAYDAGYQLWKAGKYEAAIGALRAFSSAYPNHRRTSWANNLAGRARLALVQHRSAGQIVGPARAPVVRVGRRKGPQSANRRIIFARLPQLIAGIVGFFRRVRVGRGTS